jgi:hypothetical protein
MKYPSARAFTVLVLLCCLNVLSHVWRGVCLSAEGVVYLIMCISFVTPHVVWCGVVWCGVVCVVWCTS